MRRKKSINFVLILLLLASIILSGCSPQEEPPVDEPITDIDEFIRKDDEIIVVNGEQKTIKELKEEHGYAYHFFVGYSDQEIEKMYEDFFFLNRKIADYNIKNWDRIKTREIPEIGFFGFLMYNNNEEANITGNMGDAIDVIFSKIFQSDIPEFVDYKKNLKKEENQVVRNIDIDFLQINKYKNISELPQRTTDEKRAQVLYYMLTYEAFIGEAEKMNYPLEKSKDLNFRTN